MALNIEEPTAREILGPRPRMRDIAEQICRENGLTLALLTGGSRERKISWPRQEACRRCHELGYSSHQIARFFNRDHSVVIYGVAKAKERLA